LKNLFILYYKETKTVDLCVLPKEVGLCKAAKPRFYFDASKKLCEEFIYGGCGGNS
jgi:hypothetical protein